MFKYPVTLPPDDGTILVTFADVPEAITFGADEQEALMQVGQTCQLRPLLGGLIAVNAGSVLRGGLGLGGVLV